MNEIDESIPYLKGKSLEEGEWGNIVVIKPNGEFILHNCEPSLENMQSLVGGYVEVVPRFNHMLGMSCVVLCDEEGKLKGYPANGRATLEWVRDNPMVSGLDMLVGDIVVLTGQAKKVWER